MQDVDNLYGLFELYATRNIHQKPVLCQHRVECRYGIARCCGQLTIVFGDEIGIFLCVLAQRSNDNAIGKLLVGHGGLQESIVNHKVIGRAKARHIATEHLVRIDGHGQALQVKSEVGFEKLAYVGVFVLLGLARRKSQTLEIFESSLARSIHYRGGMGGNEVAVGLEEVYILFLTIHVC